MSSEGRDAGAAGGVRARLRQRIDAFLEWPYAAKGSLISALTLAFFLGYGAIAAAVRSVPALFRLVDPSMLRLFEAIAWIGCAAWSVLLASGLLLMRRRRESRLYAHAVSQAYALLNLALAYCVGPFTEVTWVVVLGAFAAGQLVFDRRIVFAALGTALVTLVLWVAAGLQGLLPFEPLLGPAHDGQGNLVPEYLLPRLAALVLFGGIFILILAYISSRLQKQQRRLEEISTRDPLTGLYNRRHFLGTFETELVRALRTGSSLAFIILDLDDFKRINDTAGHLSGDELLRRVADCLRRSVRAYDCIGRYGGDEFVALIPGADLQGTLQVAQRCIKAIEDIDLSRHGEALAPSASAGVAVFPAPGVAGIDDLVRSADEALYRAKARGRNRVEPAARE